jgi:hypothetical protein
MYEQVAARMRDARIVDVPTGHLVPMERSDLVAEHVLAFGCAERQRSTG